MFLVYVWCKFKRDLILYLLYLILLQAILHTIMERMLKQC